MPRRQCSTRRSPGRPPPPRPERERARLGRRRPPLRSPWPPPRSLSLSLSLSRSLSFSRSLPLSLSFSRSLSLFLSQCSPSERSRGPKERRARETTRDLAWSVASAAVGQRTERERKRGSKTIVGCDGVGTNSGKRSRHFWC